LASFFFKVNPISHLVSAVRDLANAGMVNDNLAIPLLGAAVFAPLTARAYMRQT
jgi:ABC-2 type transport system permease protein